MKCTPGCALFVCLYEEIGKGLTLFSRAETLKHLSPAECWLCLHGHSFSLQHHRNQVVTVALNSSRSHLLDFAVDEVVSVYQEVCLGFLSFMLIYL